MINWEQTLIFYKLSQNDKISKKQKVILSCDDCGANAHQTRHYHYRRVRDKGGYYCKRCSVTRAHLNRSAAAKRTWCVPGYRAAQESRTHTDALKERARQHTLRLLNDPEHVARTKAGFNKAAAIMALESGRGRNAEITSQRLLGLWQDQNYRNAMSQQSKDLWDDLDYRMKVCESLRAYYSQPDILEKASERASQLWADSAYRERWLKSFLESFTQDRISSISAQSSMNWANQKYRQKIESHWNDAKRTEMSEFCRQWWTDERCTAVSESMIERWADPEFREKCIVAFRQSWTDERRTKVKESWTDERRTAAAERARKLWENEDFIQKMLVIASRPSSLELSLAAIFDEYEVKYEQQYHLGPYLFDFKVDNVLVEVQGDYWHSLPKTIIKDKAKFTYVNRYHPEFKIVYLWEHEFYQLNRISSFVQYMFAKDRETPVIDFSDLEFVENVAYSDVVGLFEKYHYKGSLGRSGSIFAVRYNGEFIAACVFGTPTRNVAGGELLRFVINPQYQIKNLASWFLSRATKVAVQKFGYLFTFADPNFNNHGTIYLAANWTYAGETKPDYWYSGDNGWVMHKKTLYNRAVNFGLSEKEFAIRFGYLKVWGLPKKKYEFKLA